MKKWEYRFVELEPPSKQIESEKEFERLGMDGWELVATYSVTFGGNTLSEARLATMAIFKKEI